MREQIFGSGFHVGTHQTSGQLQLTVNILKPSRKYVDDFIRLKCAPDMIDDGVFKNAAEITESTAAFEAVRKYLNACGTLDIDIKNNRWAMLDIYPGETPKTASMFNYRTSWDCSAVDPLMKKGGVWTVKGEHKCVWCFKSSLDELHNDHMLNPECIVCVAMRGSIPLADIVCRIDAPRVIMVACERNVDMWLPFAPDVIYRDRHIWSENNLMQIWDIRN